MTATVERAQHLLRRLMLHEESADHFMAAFLRPPLYSLAFDCGFGTFFTAAYWPQRRTLSYRWPQYEWPVALDDFHPARRTIGYPVARAAF